MSRTKRKTFLVPWIMVALTGLAADRVGADEMQVNTISHLTVEPAKANAGTTNLIIHGNRPPEFTVFKLNRPPRVVIDLIHTNVEAIDSPMHIGKAGIDKIAAMQFRNEGYLVGRLMITLTRSVTYDAYSQGNDLVVAVGKPKNPGTRATKVAKASKPKPAPIAARRKSKPPKPAPAGTHAMVKDLRFSHQDGITRIFLDIDGRVKHQVEPLGQQALLLELSPCDLPSRLERSLDTTAFTSPVSMVSAYRAKLVEGSRNKATTNVLVDFSGEVSQQVMRAGDTLVWEFKTRKQSKPAGDKNAPTTVKGAQPGKVAVVSSPEERTAGVTTTIATYARSSAPRQKRWKGRRISLDFKDADIHNLLRLIADVSHKNIIASDEVQGKITIRLRNVPWDQALDIILKSKGLGMQVIGNIIRVAPQVTLLKEEEMERERDKLKELGEPLKVRLIAVNYAHADDLKDQVESLLSERGSVNVDLRTNVLIVKGIEDNLVKAELLVRNLDTATPQVLIEGRIVQARTVYTKDIGIQWGADLTMNAAHGNPTGLYFPYNVAAAGGAGDVGTGGLATTTPNFAVNLPAAAGPGAGGVLGLTLGSVSGTINLAVRLSALENKGRIHIVSAPKITTMDNREALIKQGVSIPISTVSAAGMQTIFVDAVLELRVTPHITAEGSIILNLAIKQDEPDFTRTGAQGDPTILKREAQTELLVRDGDTTVLGGIYTRNTNLREDSVPFFGRIPILGWFFRHKLDTDERQELLIFITPRIVNREQSLVKTG